MHYFLVWFTSMIGGRASQIDKPARRSRGGCARGWRRTRRRRAVGGRRGAWTTRPCTWHHNWRAPTYISQVTPSTTQMLDQEEFKRWIGSKSGCGTCRGKISGLLPREATRRGRPSFLAAASQVRLVLTIEHFLNKPSYLTGWARAEFVNSSFAILELVYLFGNRTEFQIIWFPSLIILF